MDGTVLPFNHVPRKAAHLVQLEPAVAFDRAHHSPQGVNVSRHNAVVVIVLARYRHMYESFGSAHRLVAHFFQSRYQIVLNATRIARWRRDS